MARPLLFGAALFVALVGCSTPEGGLEADDDRSAMAARPQASADAASAFTESRADAGAAGPRVLPPPKNIVPTEHGGYALGEALTGDGMAQTGTSQNGAPCSTIVGVVRDFRGKTEPGGHPDFEAFGGSTPTLSLVAPALGTDKKPVYASLCESSLLGGTVGCPYGQMTTNKAFFDEWYRFAPGMNQPYVLYLQFAPNGDVFTFQSNFYFPLDGAGYGLSGDGNDGKKHNFGFTTEIHTEFKYAGGERFTFNGDDDVWVFMNGKLAIDLGGLHPSANGTIELDQAAASLGLTKGQTYPLDLFQAERRVTASMFRVDTNLAFTSCGSIPPDVPR